MLGLYIHIPFCRKICSYCDFYKMVVSDELKSKFFDYLIKDFNLLDDGVSNVNTIYIGGGTPSSVKLELLERLFIELNKRIDLEKIIEFTFEINPEDINIELLNLLKKYNVNRLSIGVQTFNKKHLKLLNRMTDYDDLKTKVKLLKEIGFENYSFDLIYALPEQTVEELSDDLKLVCSLEPKHISTYSLILEDHTILKKLYDKKKWEIIDEEIDEKMYFQIIDFLNDFGYSQYETSNFSKEGYESKHNLIYWNNEQYYSIGPSSSDYLLNVRSKRTANLNNYFSSLDNNQVMLDEKDILSVDDMMEEEILLGLRKRKGLSKKSFFEKYNIELLDAFPNIIKLINEGLLECDDDLVFIKKEYQYIANFIIVRILEDA